MTNFQMTEDRKQGLLKLIHWYWSEIIDGKPGPITSSDYEFIYKIWRNGLGIYDDDVKERLNSIRDIYNKSN